MRQAAFRIAASVSLIAMGCACAGEAALAFPVASGGLLAPGSPAVVSGWDGNDWEIFQINAGVKTQLTDNGFDDQYPRRSGSRMAWQGWDGNDWEIFYYDGSGITQLTDNGVDEISAHFFGSLVRWQGWDGDDWEIFQFDGIGTTNVTDNSVDDRVFLPSEDRIDGVGGPSGSNARDAISNAVGTPEPATAFLLVFGTILLALQRRKKGRNAIH